MTMAEDTPQPDPQLSAAALHEWGRHLERLMRGLAHALNNRATALSAVIELSIDAPPDPSITSSILTSELTRVRELADIVRSIASPRRGVEAFAPIEAATEALAVLKLHTDRGEQPITIDAASAPPTRVPRWMFVRSLIALTGAAADHAQRTTPTRIAIVQEGDWVVVRIHGEGEVRAPCADVSPYAAELARAMGGEALEGPNECGFRVPTLAALRQREAH
jgi:hypothetical protein